MVLDTANLLRRLAGPVALASGTNAAVFTGQANHVYTIKKIRIVNTDPVNAKQVSLGIGGVTAALLILPTMTIDAGAMLDDDTFIVLTGAETIQAVASATGLTITICGLDQS